MITGEIRCLTNHQLILQRLRETSAILHGSFPLDFSSRRMEAYTLTGLKFWVM